MQLSYSTVLPLVLLCISVTRMFAELVTINNGNHDEILENKFVFIIFAADWCPFSRKFLPTFEEAANRWKSLQRPDDVVWAVINSVENPILQQKHMISKYPTVKLYADAHLVKEYRLARTVDALIEFVESHTADEKIFTVCNVARNPETDVEWVQKVESFEEARKFNSSRKILKSVIGWLPPNDASFSVFKMGATLYKEFCSFQVPTSYAPHESRKIVFLNHKDQSVENLDGLPQSVEELNEWLKLKCIPIVRELTFENAEGLVEEEKPFLILFRDPKDDRFVDLMFEESIRRELGPHLLAKVNPLVADGTKMHFALLRLGKSTRDLPVVAIDQFVHMYLFPDFNRIQEPGTIRQFVLDLLTDRLHKRSHGLVENEIDSDTPIAPAYDGDEARPADKRIPSAFKKLQPSESRYSFVKTEL